MSDTPKTAKALRIAAECAVVVAVALDQWAAHIEASSVVEAAEDEWRRQWSRIREEMATVDDAGE